MTSHTPGPWAYRGTLGPKSATHLAGPCVIEIAATGQQIAILSGWRNDRQIADAALMDTDPRVTLTSSPPKKSIHCDVCGYAGYRVA